MNVVARRGKITLVRYPDNSGECFDGSQSVSERLTPWNAFIKDAYWVPVDAQKRARTLTISSGGKKRDDALNPIIASVKRRLIALADQHGNRSVAKGNSPLSVADLSTEDLLILRAGIRKFNENHDERGRFAESDSAGLGDAIKEYDSTHPVTRLDGRWSAFKPKEAAAALGRISDLQAQFPGVRIQAIARSQGNPGFGGIAWTEVDGSIHGMGSTIGLSPRYWDDQPSSKPLYSDDVAHFHPQGTANPEGYVTHEFGHALYGTMYMQTFGAEASRATPYTPFAQWYTMEFRTQDPISGYAAKDKQEKFAELFTAAMTPASADYNDPRAAGLRTALTQSGVWKAPTVTKRDVSDEARDDHGQWTAGGSADDVAQSWRDRGIKVEVPERPDAYDPSKTVVTLHSVVVPKDQRGQGVGSQFMRDLTAHADANGKTIALTPSKDFGASSVSRLKEFYGGFGFVKNTDPSISETMVRLPKGR